MLKNRWKKSIRKTASEALKYFNPPPKLSASEWADNYRVLSVAESPLGGKWKTDNTPYLRKIMDCFTDMSTEIIAFLKPSQVGATEIGINLCAYTIDYNPARLLYVMPDETLAKDFSVDRLQKAFQATPSVAEKLKTSERGKALAIRFPGGFIRLTGAQSPAKLASWAIPRVVMDEVDKYPRWTGKEANPIKLVTERTKNFPWRKIMIMSTPTTEAGNVYQAYESSDVKYKYYMPCPECGHFQTFDFGNLKFPKGKDGKYDVNEVKEKTHYECESCHCHIRDKHKMEMLRKGDWVPDNPRIKNPRKVGFAINSLYSPFVTFSDVALQFLESKDDPADLMNFVNSWLGEPWRSKASKLETSLVMQQRSNLPAGFVPKWAKLLTGGVDVQQGYFYWTIRAWGVGMRSQKIACGQCMTFGDVQNIMDTFWQIEDSWQKMQVVLYCVDAGYNAEEVYDFCYNNAPIAVPVKGSSRQMPTKYKITSIQPNQGRRNNNLNLYIVDTDQYKNWIASHLNIAVGNPGAWEVDADTTEEYAQMICSEHKVLVTEGRYPVERWQKVSSHAQNHFLDCEVYAGVAADIMNVRFLTDDNIDEVEDEQSDGIQFAQNFKPY